MNQLALIRLIIKKFPRITVMLVCLFIVAAGAEILGISSILPLLSKLFDTSFQSSGTVQVLISFLRIDKLSTGGMLVAVGIMLASRPIILSGIIYFTERIQNALEAEYKLLLMDSYMDASWKFINGKKHGELMNAILTQSFNIGMSVKEAAQFLSNAIIGGLFLISAIIFSWEIFVFSSLIVFPMYALSKWVNKRSLQTAKKSVGLYSKINGETIEIFSMIKYVIASAINKNIKINFHKKVSEYLRLNNRSALLTFIISSIPEGCTLFVVILVFYLTYKYSSHSLNDQIVSLLLLHRTVLRFSLLSKHFEALSRYLPSFEICENNIESAMREHAVRLEGKNSNKPNLQTEEIIRFDNVHFSYEPEHPVLSGFNITVPRRQITALVGASVAGKTTTVDIMLGLIHPQQGRVLVGGVDIKHQDLDAWRNKVAYVPQNIVLFSDSIRENIVRYSNLTSEEEFEKICRQTHIDEFVEKLPYKYDTEVGEKGLNVSGGQRQRIALARALARKPELLILDEATSSLDNISERLIYQAIKEISKEVTIVLIAHRLSSVQNASRITVLDNGRVKEQGSFKDLLAKKGTFYNLYNSVEVA